MVNSEIDPRSLNLARRFYVQVQILFFLLLALYMVGEIYLRVFYPAPDEVRMSLPSLKNGPRQPLTRLFEPNVIFSHQVSQGKKKIFDAIYRIDEFGRRSTGDAAIRPVRPQHLLFFGCSFAFGRGVNDDETIPYYLRQMLKAHEPYGYGVPGGSMGNMLAILNTLPLRDHIPQAQGALVYFMFPKFHVPRLAGFGSNLLFGYDDPYYRLENGRPVLMGTFREARPNIIFVESKLVEYSYFGRWLLSKLERQPSESDFELARAVVLAARDRYLSLFPMGKFIVATMEKDHRLVKQLQKDGLEFVFLRDVMTDPQANQEYFIPGDPHFSAQGNRMIAQDLSKELREKLEDCDLQTKQPLGFRIPSLP